MGTFSEVSKNIIRRAKEIAIYDALPDDLAKELKAANAKLILTDTTFEFTNCPQELIDRVHEVVEQKKKEKLKNSK